MITAAEIRAALDGPDCKKDLSSHPCKITLDDADVRRLLDDHDLLEAVRRFAKIMGDTKPAYSVAHILAELEGRISQAKP